MLGIRPALGGLVFDPCIPKGWPGFTTPRKFRCAAYVITERNTGGTGHSVSTLRVDCERIDGTLMLAFESGEHTVDVKIR
ncbi:hypothetical protein OPU71_13410 [Niveibacterium sp. 24ML]|uniref:hypothetical protein n=1 Tax=Niveibacterium sp. 24ML TaxID=2985512 RepID=UPI0022710295|nr:hypothetical protein [Niveibacterium sp. 24ML]MCX9157125.1 hypothetical protein [Niveibacterium sp. 24ML]